jgi:hypothetical protein
MLISALLNRKQTIITLNVVILGLLSFGFISYSSRQEAIDWSNKCLYQAFDATADAKLKKWEISLTDKSFVRFRKTYQNGKQEYYSLNLRRFADMDYLGTAESGQIRIKSITDDIIVQTYNDAKGNIDSMSTTLNIPVRNMSAERIDSLRNALLYLKTP